VNGARSSTASGTTATASRGAVGPSAAGSAPQALDRPRYVGRFAPSPTGRLHLGSLFAAAGSFLQARAAGGHWLVRMEDVDAPRIVPGAADEILRTLEQLGLQWDGPVLYQSTRTEAYAAALTALESRHLVFRCSCSRQELAANAPRVGAAVPEDLFYPGTCRSGVRHPQRPPAYRFRVPSGTVSFEDGLQGTYSLDVSRTLGDFVIRRRDGLFAYQLAVVVDDAEQGVTEIVRGGDLLNNTPRQILLLQALDLTPPSYAHLPLLVEPDGQKLAKARRSLPVATIAGTMLVHRVLTLLGQSPPLDLASAPITEVWQWAIANWQPQRLRGIERISVEAT
jgi:glutamyl-Q tRNA(Asp) synthetase